MGVSQCSVSQLLASVTPVSPRALAALARTRGAARRRISCKSRSMRCEGHRSHAWVGSNALEYLERGAGQTRSGDHPDGRWEDAREWVIAHTSRDGDPQLHVHNLILHEVRRESDGAWRAVWTLLPDSQTGKFGLAGFEVSPRDHVE
jgi:hypothetical protein